jgi:hypothetical protein
MPAAVEAENLAQDSDSAAVNAIGELDQDRPYSVRSPEAQFDEIAYEYV